MEQLQVLRYFYEKMKDDHWIGPVHISLYMAIFHLYHLNHFNSPVPVNRALLMELSKIRGLATYHKCIKDLQNGGYIIYEPSYNSTINSTISLI